MHESERYIGEIERRERKEESGLQPSKREREGRL